MTEFPEHMEEKDPTPSFGNKGQDSFFQVPEGFFDAQKQSLDISLEREELKKGAPLLFSIPRAPFFQVPSGFFKQISTAIAAKVSAEPRSGIQGMASRRSHMLQGDLFPYQIAAALTIFLLGIWALSGGIKGEIGATPERDSLLSDIPTHVLVEAVSFHTSDTYTVVDILEEQGVEELPLNIFPEGWELEGDDWEYLEEMNLYQLELEGEIFDSGEELN